MKKGPFWQGLTPEQYSYIAGINETVEDKTLIRPHTRYLIASTDYSDGISLRKLGLSTDGLGYGRLPYDGTGINSGFARGMGIFQIQGSASNFSTYFTNIFPTGPTYPTNSVSSWDQWAFNSTTKTNIGSFNGRGSSPVGIALPCHVFTNGVDVLTDFMQMEGAWNVSGTTTPGKLIQQPTNAPTLGTGSGNLSGYYAYCYTLIDINGNESQPSPLVASGNLSSNNVAVSFTLAGVTGIGTIWVTARIYRTQPTETVAVSASNNPTFYHVPGIDVTLLAGTTSYTSSADNVSDLILGASYPMSNVGYINGALAALDVSAVPKFLVGWNNALWGGFWNIGGVDNPTAVYFSASVDNSGLSNGNVTSWNSYNYINVGTLDDGKIIGLYPGLQGRLYVFKEFGTYIIQPTGNSALPYSCVPISSGFGLYHHSIAEIGGAVIGRAKDGIYQFNGSSFKPLAHPLYKTMGRLIQPDADSGTYDSAQMRYYLAVCDSNITNSYQTQVSYGSTPTVATSIINAFRNTVIIFDVNSQTWETHHNEPIQCFGKLKDTGGREKIFALGMSGDVFCLVDGNCQGSTFSFLATPQSSLGNNVFSGYNLSIEPDTTWHPFVFVPFSISSDGNIQFMDFQTILQAISTAPHSSTTVYSVNNFLPINDASINFMVMIQNYFDTVNSVSSGNLNMLNNFYDATASNNYSLYDLTNSSTYMWNDGGISISGTQQISPLNESFSPVPSANDSMVILPYRFFPNFKDANNNSDAIPFHVFMTPPFGIRLNDMAQKVFQMFRLQIKGSGTLNIYGFKNGNITYEKGPFLSTPDETHSFVINSNPINLTTENGSALLLPNSYQQMVHLQGLTAKYMRFMIWMVRGTGWFEIQDVTCYSREMQELENS